LPQEEARFGARRTMPVRRLVKAGLVRVVRAYPAPFVNDAYPAPFVNDIDVS
jgi:hypothetical protein